MFSWNIHCTWDASKFILTIPLHQILLLEALLVGILLLFNLKSGHAVRSILTISGVIVAFGFLMDSTQLTLDRVKGTATLRKFQYYHWSTDTYPLADIDRVFVSTGSTTSQLRVQFTTGSTTHLNFLDQAGGKDEAAYAANKWLSQSRESDNKSLTVTPF